MPKPAKSFDEPSMEAGTRYGGARELKVEEPATFTSEARYAGRTYVTARVCDG
jgi:hypothetical protein